MAGAQDMPDMQAVNDRLKQIVEAVSDDTLDLDQALSLYEEAIDLGMRASELIEEDIAAQDGN